MQHFFHPHQIAVVAVAIDANGDVEIYPVVGGIGLFLAYIPFNAGTAQHRAGEAELFGALRRHDADIHQPLFPDAVVGQERVVFAMVFGESLGKVFEKIQERTLPVFVHRLDGTGVFPFGNFVLRHLVRQVAVDAAGTVVGGVHARAGNRFVDIHQIFAFAEGVQRHGHCAHVKRVTAHPEQMIQDARHFVEHGADVARAFRHFDPCEFFHRQAVGVFVTHHGNVVEAIHIGHGLRPGARFRQFFGATVQETDVRVGAFDLLAVQFQDHPQHAVRCRVLRPEIQGEIANVGHALFPVALMP